MSSRKLSTAFSLSIAATLLLALMSTPPEAEAQQVLMESDRQLEYPYRWQGHSPRTEGECSQAAGQALLAQLNQMSNVSQFSSFTGEDINRTLSGEFESIGAYLSGGVTYSDSQSSTDLFEATQRGLVVSVFPQGFKPDTFGRSYRRDSLTGKRESKCWGTLLYRFVIYGPDTIARTSPDSSQGQAQAGSERLQPGFYSRIGMNPPGIVYLWPSPWNGGTTDVWCNVPNHAMFTRHYGDISLYEVDNLDKVTATADYWSQACTDDVFAHSRVQN